MATFTSTLPDHILNLLSEKAQQLKLPKNKLIENNKRARLEAAKRTIEQLEA